ncbi:ComEC/Rec2 family competence protein [Streptomyces coelicoflavus]|uniref:ComEC/Rec2 family competence protein n=1 Tax=Streptomyces coelicoflavus TaxID=285562 RepID=UPI0036906C44
MNTDVTRAGRRDGTPGAEEQPLTRPPRAAVHAASGHRLGAAHPRQEGPADLRLVPPALAAWATAALMLDAPPGWAVGVVTGSLLLAGALLLAAPRGRPHVPVAALLLCVAASAGSAALHGADLRRGPVPELARRYATVTAEVEVTADPRLTRPRVRGDRAVPPTVLIEADVRRVTERDGQAVTTRTPVLVLVDVGESRTEAASSRWLNLLPTTRFNVTARLSPPRTRGDRIAAVLRVRAGRQAPETTAKPSTAQRLAGRLRSGLREATEDLPTDARTLLPGLVVGDTSRITPELEEAFKETDLTHTLAVSGANFTIVLALLLGPPGLAQRSERRGLAPRLGLHLRTTALLGGLLATAFVVVCRPDPSVLRAAACGSVALLALATGRRRSLLPALATAVLLLVLYDPWLARSYGFLLSVLATGALLTLAPRWSASLRRRRVPPRLAEALAAAGAAQALCAPVVAVLSARVSLVGVPCNLLAEFAVAPATVLGFAALATAPMAMPLAKSLAWCGGWPAEWIAGIARTGARLPGAGVDWPGSWAGAALLALVTVGVRLAGRRLLRHPWWCGLCALLLILVVVQPPPLARVIKGWPPPDWRMVMCDVGQGDALVLAAGEGTAVVVDTGPDPALVDHCLRSLGITRVPLVLLTHHHADHVAGLPGVLRGRSVGAIETTALEEPADQAEFVRRQATARHIPLRHASAGEQRRSGPLSWQVVWPPPSPPTSTAPGTEGGPNDASVTLLVRTAGIRLLLLGDLEPPAQRELARSPAAAALKGVDVLKVAHHGSAHQDFAFLRQVAPRLALISCGEDNSYGHPAPGTVAALRAQGATVLRTDRDGALAVTGTGRELRVAGE